MTATEGEFVVYRGWRQGSARSSQAWSAQRRERYLLRQDIIAPFSLDRSVLAEAVAGDLGAIEMIATIVPTPGSKDAVAKWRGSQAYEEIPRSAEWQLLGYDICDEVGTSGLTNCGYELGERSKNEKFVRWINEHHLFQKLEKADEFRAACDRRVVEHAPFSVVALYIKAELPETDRP